MTAVWLAKILPPSFVQLRLSYLGHGMKYIVSRFVLCAVLVVATYSMANAVELKGTLAQGGMAWGQVPAGSEILLDGNPVKIGPAGNFVFGFGRDAPAEAALLIITRDGNRSTTTLAIAQRIFDIERVEGLPPKTVTPPPEWRERRKLETGKVVAARAKFTNATEWLTGFAKPAVGRFSGFYGSQRILNGKARSPHYGLDIAAAIGDPVFAPAAGIVRLAATDFLLEGGIVIIDHGLGVSSTLFHMNSVDVKEGESVARGGQIGTIGAKGRASGPHVDWRVNWGSVRLDPLLLLADSEEK